MHLIISLVIGGIIGWLASIVMKANAQMGIIANVLVGIIGAALGHWLAGLIGISGSGIGSWIISLGGAIVLIALLRGVGVFKKA
jgi:uncharacterized membrane protein YeaQ/YmgE (transglycosylase-associated protein family)